MLHYITDSGPFRLIINTRFLTHRPKSLKKKKKEKTQSNSSLYRAKPAAFVGLCAVGTK